MSFSKKVVSLLYSFMVRIKSTMAPIFCCINLFGQGIGKESKKLIGYFKDPCGIRIEYIV